jgi:hypothetical protein
MNNILDVDFKMRNIGVVSTLCLENYLLDYSIKQQPMLRLAAIIHCGQEKKNYLKISANQGIQF